MGIEEANNKKQKMSDSLKGRIFSEEHRKNLSKSQKGKKFSEQSKLKLSLSMKGRKHPHKGTSGELTCNMNVPTAEKLVEVLQCLDGILKNVNLKNNEAINC